MTNTPTTTRPTVHTAADAEVVADALATHLAASPVGVFDQLLVTCEGPGTQRWLAHWLTRRLGIAAGISMPPFRSWAYALVGRMAGIDPDTDPWAPHRLAWHVLAQLERADRWAGTPLEADRTPGGTMALAGHLADVLLDYSRRRPALLARWSAGADDGVPVELAWQPQLWRDLLADPATGAVPDPVARIASALDALRSGPAPDLPDDLHLWAPGALNAGDIALLGALADHHGVHLWWPGLPETTDHPLLTALHRETSAGLEALAAAGARTRRLPSPGRTNRSGATSFPTRPRLLDRLRQDLARGVGGPAEPLDPGDTSITLHSCHGPDRQAEVLRDVLCGLLVDDPTLEPRDVLVAVADPALFPVLEAAFAQVDLPGTPGHPARTLPVRFADPELRDHNQLVACLVQALRLGRGRATATELASFLAAEPVARRFGLDEDDVRRAHDLVAAAGVRWGMNTTHRSGFGLEGLGANTWLTGLNRMLVGIAMSEDGSHAVRSALPLDDVGSSDIDVVGAVAELMVRLIRLARDAAGTHTPAEWLAICREAIQQLMAPAPDDGWQLDHAWQVLADIAEAAPADAPRIDLDDLLDLLADAARGRVPRSAFRSGAVTVCSLWPARHVPHRVVCIVGLDDGMLPRPERIDGDNVVDLAPFPGDPGPRHRDRQVFLDLLRSARDHLVLTWTGADPRSGEHRPPAVAVAELLETLETMVTLPDGLRVQDALVARHPLQPYAPASFGDPATARYRAAALSGFDPSAAAAARTLLRTMPATRPAAPEGPLATRLEVPAWQWEGGVVPLADVVDMLAHPARTFLKRRAGFTHWRTEDDERDAIPLELDGLGIWAVGSRVLAATLRGDLLDDALRAEHLRGTLPPGAAGAGILDRVRTDVERILRESGPLRAEAPVTRHVRVPLPATGLVLSADVTLRGGSVVSVAYGRVSARHRLTGWFDLLALAAAGALDGSRAHLFGRKDHLCLTAPDRGAALALLDRWVGVATVGLDTPLPLPLKTGALLATTVRSGTSATDLAGQRGLRQSWKDEQDANWQLLWGPDLADLVRAPRPQGLDPIGDEPVWMADLARGLWSPIDRAEERR
ncbi:exodeoxyribonuclease V subunit gamma [Raineyella antarctica]|nr:exodeoxyribonuclease V subunit gamma [Raineyella antarctica]